MDKDRPWREFQDHDSDLTLFPTSFSLIARRKMKRKKRREEKSTFRRNRGVNTLDFRRDPRAHRDTSRGADHPRRRRRRRRRRRYSHRIVGQRAARGCRTRQVRAGAQSVRSHAACRLCRALLSFPRTHIDARIRARARIPSRRWLRASHRIRNASRRVNRRRYPVVLSALRRGGRGRWSPLRRSSFPRARVPYSGRRVTLFPPQSGGARRDERGGDYRGCWTAEARAMLTVRALT